MQCTKPQQLTLAVFSHDTLRRTAISELLPSDRNKFPFIALGVQGKFNHSMRATTANFAVGLDRADIVERRATDAGDKLTNARGIGLAVGVLGRKPFVDVIVTCDPDTRPVTRFAFAHSAE